jgi:hypothetical protein
MDWKVALAMANWVLVFTPPNLRVPDIARLLAAAAENRIALSGDGEVLDIQRDQERVEVAQDDTASVLGEYDAGELAGILALLPHPNVFRVSYYRGTILLSETLHTILRLSDRTFIDNDRGVIKPLDDALAHGLREFLAARGGKFSQT